MHYFESTWFDVTYELIDEVKRVPGNNIIFQVLVSRIESGSVDCPYQDSSLKYRKCQKQKGK